MKKLAEFIPELSSISKTYSEIISGISITIEDARNLLAFYNSFPSVYDVESGIMDLALNAPSERMSIILKSLYYDLRRISNLYQDNREFYDQTVLRLLWHKPISFLDKEIYTQKKNTQDASDELKDASKSFELTPFNGTAKEEAAILERRVNKLTDEYKVQKTKLESLYAERNRLENEKRSITTDIFRIIYSKCVGLLAIVEKYYTNPAENVSVQSTSIETLLPMSLIAPIYDLCNGNQFESLPSIDFFHIFNLHSSDAILEVRKNEKARVCYLINQLSEKINIDKRNEWVESMLNTLNISQDYYRSKYREPVSDMPSKKNKEFAEALSDILH